MNPHTQLSVSLISLAIAATGCGDGVTLKGTVDGQRVDLADGYFVQQADYAFDLGSPDDETDGLVTVVLSTVPDACETATQVETDLQAATTAAEAAQAWSRHLPDDFWELTLVLRVDGPGLDQSNIVFDGLRRDEPLDDSAQATGTLTHYRDAFDEALWSGEADPAEYLLEWTTDGGSLDVKAHEPNARIKGLFDTEAVDPDGTEVGDLLIRFDVQRCTAMEPFFFG